MALKTRLRSILRDPHAKLFRLLWRLLPKQRMEVRGELVTYLRLFRKLFPIMGDQTRCEGMFIYDKSTDELMVFVSTKDAFPRYTVFHEHCEGTLVRHNPLLTAVYDYVLPRFHLVFEVYGIPIPDEIDRTWQEIIARWVRRQGPHAEAIIREIELAKEELNRQQLHIFYEEIRERNRFGFYF